MKLRKKAGKALVQAKKAITRAARGAKPKIDTGCASSLKATADDVRSVLARL